MKLSISQSIDRSVSSYATRGQRHRKSRRNKWSYHSVRQSIDQLVAMQHVDKGGVRVDWINDVINQSVSQSINQSSLWAVTNMHTCWQTSSSSPWYNRNAWLGVKHQVTYSSPSSLLRRSSVVLPQMRSPMVWMKVVVFKGFSVLSHS